MRKDFFVFESADNERSYRVLDMRRLERLCDVLAPRLRKKDCESLDRIMYRASAGKRVAGAQVWNLNRMLFELGLSIRITKPDAKQIEAFQRVKEALEQRGL